MSVNVAIKKIDDVPKLDDLFVFTDLRCNLNCSHCYVSSNPRNQTLDAMTTDDFLPLFAEARKFNVESVYFTGGEPFLNKDLLRMVREVIDFLPVTIYTNGTKPLENKLAELTEISNNAKHEVLLRVSLDHYDSRIHDVFYGRGEGGFDQAVKGIVGASESGIAVAVTAQKDIHNNESDAYVEQAFTDLFRDKGVELCDVKVLPVIPQGEQAGACGSKISICPEELTCAVRAGLMCHTGRTLVKYDGQVRVFPCAILVPGSRDAIKEFAAYEMGTSLAESFEKDQPLNHPSCRAYCVRGGMTCANQAK